MTSAEATAFSAQYWDRKVHPTKASQQEFLATCIDVDLEKKVQHAQWHKYTRKRGTTMVTIRIRNKRWAPVHCSVPCIIEFPALCSKM